MYSFSRAPTTNSNRLGGLITRNLYSHSSGGWKSKINESVGLISSEASLSGLGMAASLPCPHMVFPLRVPVSWSCPLARTRSHIGLGPTLLPCLTLTTFVNTISPNIVTFWSPGGEGFTWIWRAYHSAHNSKWGNWGMYRAKLWFQAARLWGCALNHCSVACGMKCKDKCFQTLNCR